MLQVHDPGTRRGGGVHRHHEDRLLGGAVSVIEAFGGVAAQLDVLLLVGADGDLLGVVEEDVGRLQRRVGEQAGGHELVLVALVLELGHAAELAEGHDALHDPGELRVFGHVGLDEEGAALGVEAARHEERAELAGLVAELDGILRDGDRVEVDDAEDGVVLVEVANPVDDRAEVVPQMEVAGRLDA